MQKDFIWDEKDDPAVRRVFEIHAPKVIKDMLIKLLTEHKKKGLNPRWISEYHWYLLLSYLGYDAPELTLSSHALHPSSEHTEDVNPNLY